MLRCLSPGINWLMGPCSPPPTLQVDTSKPQLLSEEHDSRGLTKKGKDNGTANHQCSCSLTHPRGTSPEPHHRVAQLGSTQAFAWVIMNRLQMRNLEAQKLEVHCHRTWLAEQ